MAMKKREAMVTSRDIAKLAGVYHRDVENVIGRLFVTGVIAHTKNVICTQCRQYVFYAHQKRNSLQVAAQFSAECVIKLYDMWEAKEQPNAPQTYLEALKELVLIEEARLKEEEAQQE